MNSMNLINGLFSFFKIKKGSRCLDWREYAKMYPERIVDGKVLCRCGESKIKQIVAPYHFSPVFYKCKSCYEILFTHEINEKPSFDKESF